MSPGPGTPADRRARQEERRAHRASVTDPDIVMAAAAAYLTNRSRTVHEVHARLAALGYPPPLVDATVDRLLVLGYLDDAAYAQAWIASRDRSRPRGAVALRQELLRKGVARDVVDTALTRREHRSDPDAAPTRHTTAAVMVGPRVMSADLDAAGRLLERRRVRIVRDADARTMRQRAYALLARNGFDPGVCAAAAWAFAANGDLMVEEGRMADDAPTDLDTEPV